MRNEVIYMIRDADLPAEIKALLYAVESRGEHYGRWETLAADAGMKKDRYYEWRKKVDALGLLVVIRRYDETNRIIVNVEALASIPKHSSRSGIPKEDSGISKTHSGFPETKKTSKKTLQGSSLSSEEEAREGARPEDVLVTCQHGRREYRSGAREPGGRHGFFCPVPPEDGTQCQPDWLTDEDLARNLSERAAARQESEFRSR